MKLFQKILVVIEFDEDHVDVLNRAVSLSKSNQAPLHVVSVIAPPPGFPVLSRIGTFFTDLVESAVERTRTGLQGLCEKLQVETGQEITSNVLTGRVDLVLVSEAKESGCDLVLKECEKSSHSTSRVFGSSDMNLMRKCPCPVLILKPTKSQNFKKIVVAVDQDYDVPENHLLNLELLKLASVLALADSSELHIIHIWSYPFESLLRSSRSRVSSSEADELVSKEEQAREQWLAELLGELKLINQEAVDYLEPRLHTIKGEPDLRIVEKAFELEADLVVMGTVGRVGIPGLLMGNTSETVLQDLKCSCLTVKPPGFTEVS